MPLLPSRGNMYTFVTHCHTHIGGECPHHCKYCYVDTGFMNTPRPKRYCGPLRLIREEFNVDYGIGKTIFIEHKNDLFAADVPEDFIRAILAHCHEYPDNTYVFQTKNPARYLGMQSLFPKGSILGCTIETNLEIPGISRAPRQIERMKAMTLIEGRKFITIEPILQFDVDILARWIAAIRPEFLNLGADSKGHELPEPSIEDIRAFVEKLKGYGIELREKHNLKRLMKGGKS
jgi:DNA repair photolyase